MIRCLSDYLASLLNDVSLPNLFSYPPVVEFCPSLTHCSACASELKVQKTCSRTVSTLHVGQFQAREVVMVCKQCNQTYRSEELCALVPPGSNFGYDVMVYVGESMFFNHRQAKEIQTSLRKLNVPISVSEIEYLSRRFIVYLSLVHERNNSGIIEIMDANGGYILHLDALGGSNGGERLISGVDGISDIVLGNAKIKSENSDYIIPFLKKIKKRFGKPLAVVQDMGKGIMKAVSTVFPGILILICHFHFLRDIGKDLLGGNYDVIRKRLRYFGFLTKLRNFAKDLKFQFEEKPEAVDEFHQARNRNRKIDLNNSTEAAIHLYTIIEWVLDWKSESDGYGFPFDHPHVDLASRVKSAFGVLNTVKSIEKTGTPVSKIRQRVTTMLMEITEDTALKTAMGEIDDEIKVFDELRNAMRIAPKNGDNGLNDEGECEDIKTIEDEVDAFRVKWAKNFEFSQQKKGAAFIKQIDKYREQLFADPITVETADGTKTIQPQRTNNLMEQMFRDFTRDNKRKTGVDSIGRTIQAMVDNTPLVRNLKNKDYRKIIMGSKSDLAEVFAEIDVKTVRERMKEHNISNEKIPAKIQSLLKKDNLPDILSNLADLNKSNGVLGS